MQGKFSGYYQFGTGNHKRSPLLKKERGLTKKQPRSSSSIYINSFPPFLSFPGKTPTTA